MGIRKTLLDSKPGTYKKTVDMLNSKHTKGESAQNQYALEGLLIHFVKFVLHLVKYILHLLSIYSKP